MPGHDFEKQIGCINQREGRHVKVAYWLNNCHYSYFPAQSTSPQKPSLLSHLSSVFDGEGFGL